ncbi:hypothetical protein [Brachybacterium sp. YJGR34]|uniref:hypothetical protein n=1 Tax=Brachybacterium sp. YJGR34 TaxID=2059911 RepID=UPI000E0B120F|nr:hypothetical protein [Brachybacterium sp. YJGR34]
MHWTHRLAEAQEHVDFLEVGLQHARAERDEVILDAHREGATLDDIAAVPGIAREDVEGALTPRE